MEQVKVYDHAGNEFLAPSQEAAEKAVESGQYFFERPDESLAATLGLQPVAVAVAADSGMRVERDGTDRLFVYDAKGKRHSMWAVDAKECVKSGQFFWTPPAASVEESVVEASEGEKETSAKPAAAVRRRQTSK